MELKLKLLAVGIMLLMIVTPLTAAAENFVSPSSESIADVYNLKRNFSAFDSVTEIDEEYTNDYICGGTPEGTHGDDCTYDQSTMKGLYRETFEPGTRFDKRVVTVENYGAPHFVNLDVYVCYKIKASNSAPNNLDCKQTANDLYKEETHTFLTNSHRGSELFVYIIAREGSDGDQTEFGIKVETIVESNGDQVEPRALNTASPVSDQVCQQSCDSASDADHIDSFTMSFHKGDSFEIEFWSNGCEPQSGNVNYQIRVILHLWRPSSPELPRIESWNLNEQDCGRNDGYETLIIRNADEGGELLVYFRATDGHGDTNPAAYEIHLVEHDISFRDLTHDEDQDGIPDVQEVECMTNYWYDQDTPEDTDGDLECDYLDTDDDDDGVLDSVDNCPLDYIEQSSVRTEDHDGDGCQNLIDSDDDNDGVNDNEDLCPLGFSNTTGIPQNDFDGDGCLDGEDMDDDNDNWSDSNEEDCLTNPRDSSDVPPDFDEDLLCDYLDVDDDNDGIDDASDSFPQDPQEWEDTDGDGIGNNADSDDDGDAVKDVDDAFPLDSTQSSDMDGDGCGDNPAGMNGDQFPYEPTQCSDADGDGFGDNQDGVLPDFFPYDSTQWSDMDGDSFGDNPNGLNPDAFPLDPTQWVDGDGDGYGDNPNGNSPDAFPTDGTQTTDSDGDGYGDNPSGFDGDLCPLIYGTSYRDAYGCLDLDLDGWSNDGDDCPARMGFSYFDRKGCADSDDDGFSDPDASSLSHPTGTADAFPFETTQYRDSDGDGYGDNISGQSNDDCPLEFGTSSMDRMGCPDQDGDGWSNSGDLFPNEPTQWGDSDGDGYGDETDGKNGDRCPTIFGNSTGKARGCVDDDGDGIRDDDDVCSGGRNPIQDTRNTCMKAVFNGDTNPLQAQGATLLMILPLLYFLVHQRSNNPPEDEDNTPYDSD